MKFGKLAFAILVWSCLQPAALLACRYNVRDVGFVDLETEPYHFYAFVRQDTPAEVVSLLKTSAELALRDSNVSVEVVNTDEQKQHPALRNLPAESAASFPAAVLVSPDGQALPLTLAKPGQPFREAVAAALDEIVSSPTREEIVRTVSQTFGAVLLIEGDNAEANSRARKTIADAIEQIRAQMKWLPKAIAEPPVMLVLDLASLAREKVLLWSLRLNTEQASAPRAAVLYGKARWIGPMMNGEEIAERNLTGIFSIMGADCECGLDISWTQGTRLPVRWDQALHAQVAKALGFDPENPMVKIEVSRILGRRGSSTAPAVGYQELALDTQPSSTASGTPAAGSTNKAAANQRQAGGPTPTPLANTAPLLQTWLLFMAGLTVVVLSAGCWIILRAARKRRLD